MSKKQFKMMESVLSEAEYKEFVKECKKSGSGKHISPDYHPACILYDAFSWEDTTKGYKYWERIYNLLDTCGPDIDFDALPKWAKYVFRYNKGWFWSTKEPRYDTKAKSYIFNQQEWDLGNIGIIPKKYAPKWKGDDKDSLVHNMTA